MALIKLPPVVPMVNPYISARLYEFLNQVDRSEGTITCVRLSFTLEAALLDVVRQTEKIIRAHIPSGWAMEIIANDEDEFGIEAGKEKPGLFMTVRRSRSRVEDPREIARSHFPISLRAPEKMAYAIADALHKLYGDQRLPEVSWVYKVGADKTETSSIILDPPDPVYPEFYPFIEGGADDYLDDYLNDRASLLFMAGPPGTGKTSLIRHFLQRHGLRAVMTYEDALLSADHVFVNFLLSPHDNVLLIEDADTMLAARDHDGNKRISRFLNVSDGVVKLSDKKIIFTTNLGNFKDVDEALIRPGRCFGVINFRPLTFPEATAAAYAAKLPEPRIQRDYTLAELFNQQAKVPSRQRRVGF